MENTQMGDRFSDPEFREAVFKLFQQDEVYFLARSILNCVYNIIKTPTILEDADTRASVIGAYDKLEFKLSQARQTQKSVKVHLADILAGTQGNVLESDLIPGRFTFTYYDANGILERHEKWAFYAYDSHEQANNAMHSFVSNLKAGIILIKEAQQKT